MTQAKSEKSNVDRIRNGEVYTTADIIQILKVSPKTVTFWYKIGLVSTALGLHPKAKRVVNGDDLILFLKCYGMACKMLSFMGESNGEEEEETEG